MRFAGRLFALALVGATLVWPSAEWGRPLVLASPTAQTRSPIALLGQAGGARLTTIDETSLAATRPRSASLGFVDAWAFSPGGRLIAVAAHPYDNGPYTDSIRFVTLPKLRLVRRTIALGGPARAMLWGRVDRLVALVDDCCSGGSALATIDVGARRVLSRRALDGAVSAIARAPGALVVLLAPQNAIGAARVVVAAADGTIRSVPLDQVRAGWSWPQDSGGSDPVGTQRLPGVAIDPDGYRAFVLQPDGPAAEIDLRALAVSYHELAAPRSALARLAAWLQPAAEAKGLNGPRRQARWLGGGLIALTGSDEQAAVKPNGQLSMTVSPAGVAIVDTRDWKLRMLDGGADAVAAADGYLLVTGRTSTSESERSTGMGLAVYGPDGSARFRLFAGASAWIYAVLAGKAYVSEGASDTPTIAVIELASGRVLDERHTDVPVPLLVDGPDN